MQKYYAIGCLVSDSDEKQRFLSDNFLAIGWDKIGDLKQYSSIEEISEAIKKEYPKDKNSGKIAFKNFINLKEGDKVCLKSKTLKRSGEISTTIFAVGEIKKGYPEGYKFEEGYGHKIFIDWKKVDPELVISGVALSKTLEKVNQPNIQIEIENLLGEGIYDKFEEYYKKNSKEYKKTDSYTKAKEARMTFLEDYPFDDFSDVELEEYAIGSGIKDTICYGFEFGKYKEMGPGIGGGSAGKYGIYFSKDKGTYVNRHGVELENYNETWLSIKNAIIKLIKDVKNAESIDDFDDSIEELKSMQLPLTKLLNAYCPEKIFGAASYYALVAIADKFHIHHNPHISGLKLNFLIYKTLLEQLPFLKEEDPDIVAHMIRTFSGQDSEETDMITVETSDPIEKNSYSKYNFLDEVFMTEAQYDEIANTLLRKKNIILMGAPGVGKTFCAKKLMYSIMGEKASERIVTVQFHQSYSYEDFIQGYRPNEKGNFELKEGVFYKLVTEARKEYEKAVEQKIEPKKYCIVIDEINRGNLSKVFGELMMLIESDKRRKEWSVKLTYSDKDFYIPSNLYIIGTMNTADRSLTMVDYALRRRFAFIELAPAFSNNESAKKLKNWMVNHDKVDSDFVDSLIEKYARLNKSIEATLGSGFCIGHSYFIGQNLSDNSSEVYTDIVNYEIKPLLDEYYYDDKSKVDDALGIIENI